MACRPGSKHTVTLSGNFHCVFFRHTDFWKRDFQDAFIKFGMDLFRIHFDRQANRSHQYAVAEFMPIELVLFVFFLELPICFDQQAVACDLNFDVFFFNAG